MGYVKLGEKKELRFEMINEKIAVFEGKVWGIGTSKQLVVTVPKLISDSAGIKAGDIIRVEITKIKKIKKG